MAERRFGVRRRASEEAGPESKQVSSPGGVAGQLLRMQATGGNQATLALLRKSIGESEGGESESDDTKESVAELADEIEGGESEGSESDDGKDGGVVSTLVRQVVVEGKSPGQVANEVEAKDDGGGVVAKVVHELESSESESDDGKDGGTGIVAALLDELEGDESEKDES